MNTSNFSKSMLGSTEVYTDLNSLNKLKLEKNKNAALEKVAKQFESMFIQSMMKSMRSANAVFEEDSLFNSNETQFYRDMYDQQLSLTLSQKKGIGIADALYRQMSQNYLGAAGGGKTPDPSVERNTSMLSPYRDIAKKSSGDIAADIASSGAKSLSAVKSTASKGKQSFESPKEFVDTILPLVEPAAKELGVEPEYLVAQAALETGWGSKIVSDKNGSSNNLFNIKVSKQWKGDAVQTQTGEYKYNRFVMESAKFRKYDSLQDSVNDYVNFLKTNPRYEPALSKDHSGIGFIQELQKSGYATDPNYAKKIDSVYKRVMASAESSAKPVL